MQKTFSLSAKDIQKKWILLDAEGVVLGRLASFIAHRLRGKHEQNYTQHMNSGDMIVVINAKKISMTANKFNNKIHYRHTGYPGGIKSSTPMDIINSKFPEKLLTQAVRRMLPRGPLGRDQLKNLYVYPNGEHRHEAQKPAKIDFAKLNPKNIIR